MATKTTSAGSARTTAATGAKRTAGKTAAATTPAVRTTAAAGAKRVVGKSDAATTATAATRVAKKARSAADTAAKLSGSASKAGLSALGTASDLGGLVAEASRNTLAINPLIGLNKRDVASAAGSLLKAVASTPRRASTHLGRYVKELGQVAKGKSELVPDPKDRRFADPAWKSNALYARLMQSYLATPCAARGSARWGSSALPSGRSCCPGCWTPPCTAGNTICAPPPRWAWWVQVGWGWKSSRRSICSSTAKHQR